MKPLLPIYLQPWPRGGVRTILLATLLALGTGCATVTPRAIFLAAKQTATDANFRNDQTGLRAALARFSELTNDPALGPHAIYQAAWTEWMLAASQLQEKKNSDARASLESAAVRLRSLVTSQPDDAEAHGLLAWVLLGLASSDPAQWKVVGAELGQHYRRALALAPHNPRVVMLDGTMIFYRPAQAGGGQDKGLARWREALELVRTEKILDATLPDWGRILAEGWLANICLTAIPPHADEARDLATKALRQRPDFWYVATQVLPKTKQP